LRLEKITYFRSRRKAGQKTRGEATL
jgi:hypothetical protein